MKILQFLIGDKKSDLEVQIEGELRPNFMNFVKSQSNFKGKIRIGKKLYRFCPHESFLNSIVLKGAKPPERLLHLQIRRPSRNDETKVSINFLRVPMVSKKVLCYLLFMHDLEIIYKDLESLSTRLESNLLTHMLKFGPRGNDKEVYKYSLLPAGKLFRPMLCALSYLEEMNKSKVLSEFFMPSKDISLYASFLEIHHVYTLIHDDLPAMDNDNFRRGRLANHIKFNEWKALLPVTG